MKKQSHVWKLVRIIENKFISFNSSPFELTEPAFKGIPLEYKVGFTTVPIIPNSKIFVFKTRKDARNFHKEYDSKKYKILKCHYTGELTPIEKAATAKTFFRYKEFWMNPCKNYSYLEGLKTPKGSYTVDSVTPFEISS